MGGFLCPKKTLTSRKRSMKTPRLYASKLIIGYCIEALQYATACGGTLLVNDPRRPHSLEKKDDHESWHNLSFELGLRGQTPIPSEIESIRIADNVAHIATEYFRKIEVQFEELYVFDLERVDGLPLEEEVKEYLIYDWFNIRRGAALDVDRITSNERFIKEAVFYPSERVDGNTRDLKDCYSISYVNAEELYSFESSETSARLAVDSLMRTTIQDLGTTPLLEHNRRDIYKHKKRYSINEELPTNIFCCNIHL